MSNIFVDSQFRKIFRPFNRPWWAVRISSKALEGYAIALYIEPGYRCYVVTPYKTQSKPHFHKCKYKIITVYWSQYRRQHHWHFSFGRWKYFCLHSSMFSVTVSIRMVRVTCHKTKWKYRLSTGIYVSLWYHVIMMCTCRWLFCAYIWTPTGKEFRKAHITP